MKKFDMVRALRDADYRNSLSAAEQAQLPAHPAGVSAVDDDALRSITGGCGWTFCNSGCGPRGTTWIESCVGPGEACP